MVPIKMKSEEAGTLGDKEKPAYKVAAFFPPVNSPSPQSQQKFFLAELGTRIRTLKHLLITVLDLIMLGIFTHPSFTYIFIPLWPKTGCRGVSCCLNYTFLVLPSIPVERYSSEAVILQEFPDVFPLIHFFIA